MKKRFGILILALGLVLSGCGGAETAWETVSDDLTRMVSTADPAQMVYTIPENATLAASTSDSRQKYYTGPEGTYEMMEQIFAAESLNEATKNVTGFDADRITMVKTTQGELDRYDMSWTAAGDQQQVCRGAMLYDGAYYYCLTFAWAETASDPCADVAAEALRSLTLGANPE